MIYLITFIFKKTKSLIFKQFISILSHRKHMPKMCLNHFNSVHGVSQKLTNRPTS